MTEAKVSNCLLITIMILTTIMFIWTVSTLINVNQIITPATISAFNG